MNAELRAVCDTILSAVLNGAGQGLVVVVLLALFVRTFRRLNAATRHALEFQVLFLLTLLFAGQFWAADLTKLDRAANDLVESSVGPLERSRAVSDLPFTAIPKEALATIAANDANVSELNFSEAAAPRQARWTLPAYLSEVLVGLWISVALVRLAALARQYVLLRQIKNEGGSAPQAVRELFSRLCVELGVSRAPLLKISGAVKGPITVGFKQPAIVLPEGFSEGTTTERLEHVLRHEMAHVLRRDDWVNLFQRVVEAVFFFHPGVHWVSRRMAVDREIACDDHVLSGGANPQTYALSLTEFASRYRGSDFTAAPAAWSKRSQLKQRIDMILNNKRNISPKLARGKAGVFALAAILAATVGFQAIPRLAFGEPLPEPPPAEPQEPARPNSVPVLVPSAQPEVSVTPKPFVAIEPTPDSTGSPASTSALERPRVEAYGETLYAAASSESNEAGKDGARRKNRLGDEDQKLGKRLDRLEKLVQTLVRHDAESKKNIQFEFNDGLNKNFNSDEISKLHERMAKDVQKAHRDAEKAMIQAKKRAEFEHGLSGEVREEGEDWNLQHKVLEEQRQALEKQMRALEREIKKLERERDRLENERETNKERRDEGKNDELQ